ncbi:hypothetical protein L3X38_040796 [Prunus dulcis]|uniref:Uncharacterized protein n=1 Tax=Prunus dulcis TaxID=3755 RepID=A0AAD4UST5_PRUDU|nr:hypothetical protein L3X38_040796 [Prunus dulcis]
MYLYNLVTVRVRYNQRCPSLELPPAACPTAKCMAQTSRKNLNLTPGNGSRNNTLKVKNEHSESSDEEEFDGTVQADYAFFDPKPDDFPWSEDLATDLP